MRKLLTVTAVIFVALASPTGRVAAAPEMAAETGQLQVHLVETPDNRVTKLQNFLESYDSPLKDEAKTFVEAADRYNIDWKLVAAIAGTESTFGKQIPTGSYNAWGWGIPTGAQSGIGFQDWKQGIETVSEGLAKNYYGKGAKSLYDVGWIYAANGISWGNHTRYFVDKIDAFVPTSPRQLSVSI